MNDGYLAGAVLGDVIKGPIPQSLPPALRAGVYLHRRIDSFSNRQGDMKVSVLRFHPSLRRPAPILLDILADHCLSLTWACHATEPVRDFTMRIYAALARHDRHVSEAGRPFVDRMIETDLLGRYGDPEVIERAMAHVLDRLDFGHLREHLAVALTTDLPMFLDDFGRYFPALKAFATRMAQSLNVASEPP